MGTGPSSQWYEMTLWYENLLELFSMNISQNISSKDIAIYRSYDAMGKATNLWLVIFINEYWVAGSFPGGLAVKNPSEMQELQETQVQSLGWEAPLDDDMATHSSILTWRIPWTEEPRWVQSIGLQSIRHDWLTFTFILTSSSHPHGYNLEIYYYQLVQCLNSFNTAYTL